MVSWGTGHNLEKNLRKVQGLRERGQLDRALKQLQDWARKFPDTPHYLYEAAMVAFELQDYSAGLTSLKTLLRTLPDTREKVLTACQERYDEKPALPLAEFLVEAHLGDGLFDKALEVSDRLSPESVELWAKKATMRHQSLVVTPNTPQATLRQSHGVQLVVGHALGDSTVYADALAALLEFDPEKAEEFAALAAREGTNHSRPAPLMVVEGACRAKAADVAEASRLWARAARLDKNLVETLRERMADLEPESTEAGDWWRARGDLAAQAGDGKEAAQAYTQAADASPQMRNELLECLEAASQGHPDGLEDLLKLRLRLLVVQKRHEDVPALAKQLLDEELATPQELRALMGENQGGEVSAEMLAALAETALHDGDLAAAATHANEIPAHEDAALGRVLSAIDGIARREEGAAHLQLLAMRAMLLARTGRGNDTNETLMRLWEEHPDEAATAFQIMDRCLEQVEPTAELWLAQLAPALLAGRSSASRAMLERILRGSAAPEPEAFDTRFGGADELTLDFGSGGTELSDELVDGLVETLEANAEISGPFLELVDGCSRELGLAQRLRYPIALAALQAEQLDRALPEFSVLLMMADGETSDRVLGHLEAASERAPDDADLQVAVADLLLERNRAGDAAERLGAALRLAPGRAEELSERFEAMLAREEYQSDATLWRSYAEALFHCGRYDQLEHVCFKASQHLVPADVAPLHLLQCRTLIEEGRLTEVLQSVQKHLLAERIRPIDAVELMREVLRANPASSMAMLLLGQSCTKAGLIEEAVQAYLDAVRIDPGLESGVAQQLEELASRPGTNGAHLVRVARFHLDRNDNAQAAHVLERALRLDVGHADLLLGELGPVLDSPQGDLDLMGVGAMAARHAAQYERACEILVRMHQRDAERRDWVLAELVRLADAAPELVLPALCRARVLLHHGSHDAAASAVVEAAANANYSLESRIEMLHEFQGRVPRDTRLPLALAALLGEKGALDAAVEMIRGVEAESGFDPHIAVAVTETVLQHGTEHPELRLLHHDLLVRVGRVDDALRALPNPEVLSERQQSEISGRMAEYENRVNADPRLAATYARSLRRQGRTEEAIEVLQHATERTGARAEDPLWTELARMLHESGDDRESARILRRQAATVEERRRAFQLFDQWNRQRLDAEIDALEQRRAQRPNAAHLALQLSEKLLSAGEAPRVVEILREDLPDGEWKAQRACLLARAHLELDRADRAEALLLAIGDEDDGHGSFAHERQWLLAVCAERLGRPADSYARYLTLIDDPRYGDRAAARARRNYGDYLQEVAGEYRAVLHGVSSL